MAVDQISSTPETPDPSEILMAPPVFHYTPLRYLQTMLAIAWAAFAHPFSSTVIDLTTGEVRHESSGDGE
jgi:hypothetical protein